MNYQKYLVSTTVSSDKVLDDWRWLTGPNLELWHITKAGDAFLREPRDGSIHFLDVIAGKVERIAGDDVDFESAIADPENADRWLMPDIVDGQAVLGMHPAQNECLSLAIPPALGGKIDPDNIETCDVITHFSIAGQIFRQLKDMTPGTRITKINILDRREPAKRPWWKFW